MKKGTLFLQLTAGALFVALLILIVSSKFLVNDEGSGTASGRRPATPAGPRPEDESRVLFANVGNCLLMLTPLHLQPRRSAFDRKWLTHTVGGKANEESFLMLHLFGRGQKCGLRYDSARDRVELGLSGGETVRDAPLAARLSGLELSDQDRLLFRTLVPEEPVDLPANGLAKVLLCFRTQDAWSRLVSARLHRGGADPVTLRPAAISHVAWQALLSGGPIPEGPFSASPEPSLPAEPRQE